MPNSESSDARLDDPNPWHKRLTDRILWLGAIILAMLAGFLITLGVTSTASERDILLGLGINFLSGAVGAALFELLIRRPQREGVHPVTKGDFEVILKELGRFGGDLDTSRDALARIARFAEGHSWAETLDQIGVAAVYAGRRQAYADMCAAVEEPDVTRVRIMGVTLSGFLDATPGSPWNRLVRAVTKEGRAIRVQVLICDPGSLGARLIVQPPPDGGRAETDAGPFRADLEHTLARLGEVRKRVARVAAEHPDRAVSVEVRISRMPSQTFLFITDGATYVQPYYHANVAGRTELPLLAYLGPAPVREAFVMQFDNMWEYAAADPDNLIEHKPVKVDEGVAVTGLMQVFISGEDARRHMTRLLRGARRRVWIQGISNVPILGEDLSDAFSGAAHRAGVDVRVLVLDPRCRVARQKSYARYESAYGADGRTPVGWEAYREEEPPPGAAWHPHDDSEVTSNIRNALDWFCRLARGVNGQHGPDKMAVRICESVEGFVLIVDDYVLVEPYHYGDEVNNDYPEKTRMQLAENMPLFEFHRPRPAPFAPTRERVNPVRIYESHFTRVFERFSSEVPAELTRRA